MTQYVILNAGGTAVLTLFASPQPQNSSVVTLADNDQKVLAFLNPQQPALAVQLAALDSHIPRGLEDYWSTITFNTALLPAVTQTKLASKISLRAQLAALIQSNTP